jgi:hypothetical protein
MDPITPLSRDDNRVNLTAEQALKACRGIEI